MTYFNKRSMRIGCPVSFEIVYNRVCDKLMIKKAIATHNHDTNGELFRTVYPKNRLEALQNENLSDQVGLEPKSKKFKYFLEKKYGTYLTPKDCANIKSKFKKTDEKEVNESLNDIASEFTKASGNIFDVCVNEQEELQSIYIQTKEGVDLFNSMPSVLMVDGTYKINSLDMPLFIFMASDSLNSGRIIASCLVTAETKDIIDEVLKKFKQFNAKSGEIKMIIADKDMSQIASLKKAFPGANVHLCLFHILQAFLRQMNSLRKQSSIESQDIELAMKMFRQMAFSTSESEYHEISKRFCDTFPEKVTNYFKENWGHMSEMWAGYAFKNVTCYGETTNNKLESKNGQIKTLINHTDNLDMCLRKLIRLMQDDHANSKYKVSYIKLTTPKLENADSALLTMIKLGSTPKAVSIVKKNEKLAQSKSINSIKLNANEYEVFY